jgi:hypothetical protein
MQVLHAGPAHAHSCGCCSLKAKLHSNVWNRTRRCRLVGPFPTHGRAGHASQHRVDRPSDTRAPGLKLEQDSRSNRIAVPGQALFAAHWASPSGSTVADASYLQSTPRSGSRNTSGLDAGGYRIIAQDWPIIPSVASRIDGVGGCASTAFVRRQNRCLPHRRHELLPLVAPCRDEELLPLQAARHSEPDESRRDRGGANDRAASGAANTSTRARRIEHQIESSSECGSALRKLHAGVGGVAGRNRGADKAGRRTFSGANPGWPLPRAR